MNRRPRRRPTTAPLPQRQGIDPVHLRFPPFAPGFADTPGGAGTPPAPGNADEAGTPRAPAAQRVPGSPPVTARAYLLSRLGAVAGHDTVDRMLRSGAFVTADGTALAPDAPYVPGLSVWFHRDLAPEPSVPFPVAVLHRDDRLLVVDKPHFLATTPRGSHVTETALARLRRDLDLPALSPAHRLDRLTAGLVLFTVRPDVRGAYQTLFRDRQVHKEYAALARYDPAVALPRTLRSRIEKTRGIVAAREVPGEPNSETGIELVDHKGDLGCYRLVPRTGRTHQLRVHMNSLGLPILGDPYFPQLTDPSPTDFRRPLQLLARVLEFTDPLTGVRHRFESRRTLQAWADQDGWTTGRTP
ncbi:RluA family pseudouridine synthase [Streptomyces candidus]|uniref:RNA pseudouridylate synthase n=1 Tax=Streptomyces candidus TaxID=67283 RepID=A0A7X0HF72_9ACTN|nr:RluA family pseudouridine synthase [Streptomyces candidus]MBB6436421.1 tRNA pseudouridine32 synthase/23S rRNA pseudouridine746 synthase [Streptomyces candidus]GHH48868.1 pseudouridylate synthase [Streptomyces candidus]